MHSNTHRHPSYKYHQFDHDCHMSRADGTPQGHSVDKRVFLRHFGQWVALRLVSRTTAMTTTIQQGIALAVGYFKPSAYFLLFVCPLCFFLFLTFKNGNLDVAIESILTLQQSLVFSIAGRRVMKIICFCGFIFCFCIVMCRVL